MAAYAVRAQLALMCVGMTGEAVSRQAQISARRIFHNNAARGGGGNVRRLVASFTGRTGVAPFQDVASASMVEFRQRCVPPNQGEILTVVLRVAAHAAFPRHLGAHQRRVEPPLFLQTPADLGVAIEALVFGRSLPDVMAIGAVCRTAQESMRPGELAGRDLGARGRRTEP